MQALFEQAGVIRVESIAQLFDTALLLAHQPLPRGDRVAVVGNSSAIGVLAADAVLGQGLELAGAPVDVGASAGPERAGRRRPRRSCAATTSTRWSWSSCRRCPSRARRTRGRCATRRPTHGGTSRSCPLSLPPKASRPSSRCPDRTAHRLAARSRPTRARSAPCWRWPAPPGTRAGAPRRWASPARPEDVDVGRRARGHRRRTVRRWTASSSSCPTTDVGPRCLSCYGIEIVAAPGGHLGRRRGRRGGGARLPGRGEGDRRAAGGAAPTSRASASTWPRRTPCGRRTRTSPSCPRSASVYVQRMARRGIGCAIGVQDDPSFGTLVSFGLSGVVSDLLGDRAYRAVPLTDVDAAALVRAPKAAPLLDRLPRQRARRPRRAGRPGAAGRRARRGRAAGPLARAGTDPGRPTGWRGGRRRAGEGGRAAVAAGQRAAPAAVAGVPTKVGFAIACVQPTGRGSRPPHMKRLGTVVGAGASARTRERLRQPAREPERAATPVPPPPSAHARSRRRPIVSRPDATRRWHRRSPTEQLDTVHAAGGLPDRWCGPRTTVPRSAWSPRRAAAARRSVEVAEQTDAQVVVVMVETVPASRTDLHDGPPLPEADRRARRAAR